MSGIGGPTSPWNDQFVEARQLPASYPTPHLDNFIKHLQTMVITMALTLGVYRELVCAVQGQNATERAAKRDGSIEFLPTSSGQGQ
jgi:hypothetical protein